jgi:cyclopropane-fatty-acyl-phospholipid synthase
VKLGGLRHSKTRAAKAIAHPCDVGNEFYDLVLGQTMAYSCAYYDQEPGAVFGLDQAQLAKVDLVARKLGLKPGMRVLDVGCGRQLGRGCSAQHCRPGQGVAAVHGRFRAGLRRQPVRGEPDAGHTT